MSNGILSPSNDMQLLVQGRRVRKITVRCTIITLLTENSSFQWCPSFFIQNWPMYTTQKNTFGCYIEVYWKSKTIVCNRNTTQRRRHVHFIIEDDIRTSAIISYIMNLSIKLSTWSRYIGGVTIARFSDYLISSGRLSLLTSRRVFNTISQVVPAITIVSMGYVGCSPMAVVTVNIIGMFFNGAISSGHFASGVDLSPNYAGTIFGVTNTVSGGKGVFRNGVMLL